MLRTKTGNNIFITIEGIDGSGKSTQAKRLAQWLEDFTRLDTVSTFEPGGWDDGKSLREFILSSKGYSAKSELLLFLADRSEHVSRVILPALRAGRNVICERWNDSTLAYQSGGHELNISDAERIIAACNFPEPDIKILLDIEPDIAISRIASHTPDKFESEGLALMRKVSGFYRSRASEYMVTDCSNLTEDEVFTAIISRLEVSICRSR